MTVPVFIIFKWAQPSPLNPSVSYNSTTLSFQREKCEKYIEICMKNCQKSVEQCGNAQDFHEVTF